MTPEQIQAIRLGLGLSRTEFAARIGVTESTVWYWEQGERFPRGPTLIVLRQLEKEAKAGAKGR